MHSSATRGDHLPQRVTCQGCNHVLYEGAELKPPDEIIHQYEGKCPKCDRKLSLLPVNVEVKPAR
jgi:phage FluMu protein Com